jgi:hypothetical protein
MGSRIMKRSNLAVSALLLCVLMCGPVQAESDDKSGMLNDRFAIYLGGFFPEVDSRIRLNGQIVGSGPGVDFEDTLGLEEGKSVLWGGARWRISNRNMLEFEFSNLDREGYVAGVTKPIPLGDTIVQAGADLSTTFDVTIGRLTYGYGLFKRDKWELQLKAGFHIASLSASFQANGMVCVDDGVQTNCRDYTTERIASEDVTWPLPHLGFAFNYAISPHWTVRTQAIGFAIELDSLDGSLLEVDADIIWNPWEHVGFGAGLRYFTANVESKGSRLNGEFKFEYYGPSLYFISTF